MAQSDLKGYKCDICGDEKVVPVVRQGMVHRIITRRESVQSVQSICLDDLCDSCFERMLIAMQGEINVIRGERGVPTGDAFEREKR